MFLGVGKEFPNKTPTNINPENMGYISLHLIKKNAIHCFWIYTNVFKEYHVSRDG